MLSRISQWLSTKLDGKEDDYLRLRFDALTRMKKATLDVMQAVDGRTSSIGEMESIAPGKEPNGTMPTKPRRVLTDEDECVHELGAAVENCLKLGLKHQGDHDTVSLWNVLYWSSLILDEPTLVAAIQTAATMSQTDVGKARCWIKMAMNSQTMETSLMIIYSMACDQVVRSRYEEWALMRCSDGLDLFLQMVIDLREARFNIKVDEEPFKTAAPKEIPTIPIVPTAADAGKTDGDTVATPPVLTSPPPPPSILPTSPLASDVTVSADKLAQADAAAAAVPPTDNFVEVSAVVFPHRHKGIKPWQHVFGVSIGYLSKNPYHSRFALIDPMLSIPNIVQDCIDTLYEYPDTPRLFRTTVLNVTVSQLREVAETKGALPADLDAHGAGALLLDFLKNLPESVLTSEKYEAFVASGRLKDEEASIRNIACLVQELPVHCKFLLEKIIGVMHFLQLPEHAQHNGVDVALAATMLAPVIAFKSEAMTTPAGQRKMSHTQNHDVRFAAVGAQVVERMVQHHDVIFQDLRLQVSDALERLEAKKQALLSIYQLYKMKPQVDFLPDRQYLDEISDVFVESVKKKEAPTCESPLNNPEPILAPVVRKLASPLKYRASSPLLYEGTLQLSSSAPTASSSSFQAYTGSYSGSSSRTASGGSLGNRRQTVATPPLNNTAEENDRRIADSWQKHGYNRPTILGNFDKGGVLLLRGVAYAIKNDSSLLERLYSRALPTVQSSYDAGLVSAAICKSLINLLHLVPAPEHPTINIVALSVEPFWELFDEESYFLKLFLTMFQMFDQIWHSLDPDQASFTRVFCDTESKMDELLKKAPSCVDDLRGEWEEMWRQLHEEEDVSAEDKNGMVGPGRSGSVAAPPSPPRLSKKPSFTFRPEDYKHKLLGPSNILTPEHIAYIDHSVPITSQLCRWCLLYSTETHGSSLHTLLMLSKNHTPTLLVIKDEQGNVFGGYGSDEWHRSTQYFGTGETFLFTFCPRAGLPAAASTPAPVGAHFAKYSWSRRNNYFMLCSEESLVMGGGGSFGLYLDADLSRGTTGPCETFSSRPLVPSLEFNCVHVEVWGFTTSDKWPAPNRDTKRRSVLD